MSFICVEIVQQITISACTKYFTSYASAFPLIDLTLFNCYGPFSLTPLACLGSSRGGLKAIDTMIWYYMLKID